MSSDKFNLSIYEKKAFEYLAHEKSFLKLNIIVTLLFVIGQLMQFIIIIIRRYSIIWAEIRGFIVVLSILVLLIINVILYVNFQNNIYHYQKTSKLSNLLYTFNDYKKRVSVTYYLFIIFVFLYIIFYFAGFIHNEIGLNRHPPGTNQNPRSMGNPITGLLMRLLIYFTFLLQIFYIIKSWNHIRKWNVSDKELSKLEKDVFYELKLDDDPE